MNDPYKVFRIIQTIYLSVALTAVLVMTIQMHPVITGDIILEDKYLLSRSQMTAWIIWMNTAFIFGLGCVIFSMIGKWLKKD